MSSVALCNMRSPTTLLTIAPEGKTILAAC